jgi:hypothetical protein
LPAHARLQRHGCALLTLLAALSPACTARGTASGAVDAAVAALTAHALMDPDVFHAACDTLLHNLHGDGAGGAMADRCAAVVDTVVAALGAHVASAHAVLSACALLSHAARLRADVAARIAASGFAEEAARAMWAHPADALLVEQAVGALLVLCSKHPDSCGDLYASGAAAATMAALRMHAASKEVSRLCCSLLSVLRHGDALLAPLGVLEALVAALVAHPGDAALARSCCPTLAFACQDCAHNQGRILRSGALPALAAVITAHPGVTDLQQNAADAVLDICTGTLTEAALSVAANEAAVLEAALAVLQRPGASAELSNACLILLARLSGGDAPRRHRTVAAGALEAAAAAMHAHPTQLMLQTNGCCAVGNMCAADADLKLRGGAAGAVKAVVAALALPRPHEDTSVLAAVACQALCNLARDAENGGRAIAAGALPAIVAAMDAHAVAKVQQRASLALHNIMSEVPERGLAAFAAGAIPALLAAMRTHPGAAGVQEHACNALSFVARVLPAHAVAAVSGGALPLIVAALRTHAAEPEVQHDGCKALAAICGVEEAHIVEAGAAGAVEAVLAALRVVAWQADLHMQAAPLFALRHIVGVPANAARAHTGGAVQLALAAARAHAAEADIVLLVCNAVSGLTNLHEPCFHAAVADGVVELMVKALLTFSDADGAHAALHCSGLRLLHHTARVSEVHAARAVRAGALELDRPRPVGPPPEGRALQARLQRAMLMTVLRDAVERHDAAPAACGAAAGDCRRCSTLRADGVLCSLAGCGARRRTGDPAGEGAGRRLLRCASCRQAAYCSANHQRDDWRRHKAECGAMQLRREQLDAAQ